MSTSTWQTSANPTPSSAAKAELLRRAWRRGQTPPPRLSVPAWADRYRFLAREAGSNSGRWRTSRVEIARGPMMAVTEPGVRTLTAMSCTQLLKTSLLENIWGYFTHLDPCPILLVQPKDESAEAFSKERIIPMVRATPVLRQLISPNRRRRSEGQGEGPQQPENTLTFFRYPGGFLALVGAGSPDNLARRPIRVAMYDETDKYVVTREGDPFTLGDERLATFGVNALSVRACSPTVEDESRIAASYADSDQRLASVACPHCRHRQFLDFFRHVRWDKAEDGTHDVRSARIYCEACGTGWSEGDRLAALQSIRWHQTRPFTCCGERHSPLSAYQASWQGTRPGAGEAASPVDRVWDWWESDRWAVYRVKCPTCGKWGVDNAHAGFQASKLYSPWDADRPDRIAAKYLNALGDEEKLQAWWNTQMGLPYRRKVGKEVREDVLLERRENYGAEVPDGVAVITVGGDMQGDRGEFEVVGWGRDEESWQLDYKVIAGDPDSPEFWAEVDALLLRRWKRADGREFAVEAACIDSGGHHTQAVYSFCRPRVGRRVFAIKGASEQSGQRSPVWPTEAVKQRKSRAPRRFKPVIIGTNAAKDRIAERLSRTAPGPGYMHFPHDRDAAYFAQLTAERQVVREARGRKYRIWEPRPGRANEALDCRVYAYAALCGLLHRGFQLNRRADEVGAPRRDPEAEAAELEAAHAVEAAPPAPEPPAPVRKRVPPPRPRGSSFVNGWRR